ncbi:MAG: hypothetical protein WCC87_00195, partial [Candidatus Korobacteraceae bacterium]
MNRNNNFNAPASIFPGVILSEDVSAFPAVILSEDFSPSRRTPIATTLLVFLVVFFTACSSQKPAT